jgi:hypothetical protein
MMMNNQEIIDNAPECATHIDGDEYLDANSDSYWSSKKSKWCSLCELVLQDDIRSLSDIKRIVELEAEREWLFDFALGYTNEVFLSDVLEAIRGRI